MKHTITRTYLFLFLSLFFITNVALAQEEAAAEEEEETGLSISGYVDAYYLYNFNNPSHVPGIAWENAGRVFDIKHNEFSLGLVQTMFKYTTGKSTAVVDLTYGPNGQLGNFGNVFGTDILIKQAYLSYSFSDALSLTVGQYGTHIGYELIDAPLNFNYSLSYLFGNGPFYHMGAKLDYAVSDNLGLMVGVVNGWDAMFDFNDKKSIAAQVSLAPSDKWSVYLNWIGGDEINGLSFPTLGNPDSPYGTDTTSFVSLFDLTTSYQVSDAFKIGLNAAYGSLSADDLDQDATWYGVAGYFNYALSETFGLGLRAEYFADEDGVRYTGAADFAATAITLTGDIKLDGGKFMIKPEFRYDAADGYFVNKDGDVKDSQATLGAAFIYAF